MKLAKRHQAIGLIGTLGVLMFAGTVAPAAPAAETPTAAGSGAGCRGKLIRTGDGCQTARRVRHRLQRIIHRVKTGNRLQAVIARVDLGGRTLVRRGFGNSQSGVPARPSQSFRLGSMIIPGITTVLFQLQQRGRLKVSDPISKWLPDLPRSNRITIEMLMNNSSGYVDWIKGNQDFVDRLYADPYRTWAEHELLNTALGRGFACQPGTCFHYAHTNYLILGRIIRAVTHRNDATVILRRILKPLGMRSVRISPLAPMRPPALNAYTSERDVFENSTGWSPSWSLGRNQVVSGTIDDVARGARGLFSGRTLKPATRRKLFRRVAPHPPGYPAGFYFAQGLIVTNGWRLQNPYINGYMGTMAWLPKRRLGISLAATRGRKTSLVDNRNFTADIMKAISAYLTPGHIPAS